MKKRALAVAARHLIWTHVALGATLAGPVFAQTAQTAPATGSGTNPAAGAAAAPAAASGSSTITTTTDEHGTQAKLKTFEVTGSLIRQTDKTGFNAVQTVTQKDITQSGETTVAGYLQSLSANSASSWGETTPFNLAPGGAGIALRGLSEKYTLVLIDGQRAAPYAFGSNGTDTFFDIDTIPTNMVDRIEVVKSGGVSQYGSDAIAGVVNIITKHDYQGLQLDGSLGGAAQGVDGTVKFNVLGGFGNLASDGYNVTAAASFYRASGLTLGDRSTTDALDYSALGGPNVSPLSYLASPTGVLQAPKNCFGSVGSPNPASEFAGGATGTVCQPPNAASAYSLAPQVDRSNLKVHADFKINDTTQAWVDAWESYDTTQLSKGYAYLGTAAPGVTAPTVYSPSAGYGLFNNQTSDGYTVNYAFPNQVVQNTDSNFYRVSTGVKGEIDTSSIGNWNWEASVGHSQSTVTNTVSNQLNANVLGTYLSGVTASTFDGNTLQNLPGLYGTTSQLAISKLETVDASISTPNLFHLPTGDVGAGFGTQFQHQSEYVGPGSYNYLNPYLQSVDGERNVAAVFYQFDIPLLDNLKFSQSGRYDHYSDVGGAFSPRFALRYQPIQALTAYASYDRGFRAPTLIEADQKVNAVFQSVTVNGSNYNVPEFITGNPNLAPERTKNYNLGFELSPTRNTDVGLDWYRISVSNVIGTPNPTSEVAADIAQTGSAPAFITEQFENLGTMRTDGFEATFRQALPTQLGTFTLAADWAWVWHFDLANGPGQPSVNLAGNNLGIDTVFGASFPRWKGNTSVNWVSTNRNWNATLTWQYTGPYAQAAGSPGSVGSYSQFNLFASYSGIKHWTLYAGINNIFNHKPPYDALWPYVDGSFYDSSLYSDLGVYAQIGATYKF